MTKPLPFTQASLKRAIEAARKAGLCVTGIAADGTVLTEASTAPALKSDKEGYTDPYVSAVEQFSGATKRKRHGLAP